MATDSVLNSTLAQQQARTSSTSSALNQDFDEFLILLTTQLQNQDPLNPTDTDKFTDQLVQFSQVEQQINTNQKLDTLLVNELNNNAGLALNYVGLDITYPSTEIGFDGINSNEITYVLPEAAGTAKINIRDEAGEVIYSADVSGVEGTQKFTWDGKNSGGETVPAGTYGFTIDALDFDNKAIENIPTVVTGHVTGVEKQNGAVFLLVGDRAIDQTTVIKANVPGEGDSGTDTSENTETDNEETEA